MDSMDRAILDKSKGATYMSFVLDVEVIIKKGPRANLAERKLGNKNEIQKREYNRKKELKNKGNDNKTKGFSGKPNDIKVYPVRTKAMNVFSGETVGLSDKDKDALQSERQEEILKQFTASKDVDKGKYSDANIGLSEKHKKRRTTRTERKSQLFKGKIEPIDFLECNRIFMCNHVHIQKYGHGKYKLCSYRSAPNLQCKHQQNVTFPRCATNSEHKCGVRRIARIASLIPINDSNFLTIGDTGDIIQSKINDTVDLSCGDNNLKDFCSRPNFKNKIKQKNSEARFSMNQCENYEPNGLNNTSKKGFVNKFNTPIITINLQSLSNENNIFLNNNLLCYRDCKSLECLKADKVSVEMNRSQSVPYFGLCLNAGDTNIADKSNIPISETEKCKNQVIETSNEEHFLKNHLDEDNKQGLLDLKVGYSNDNYNPLIKTRISNGDTELVNIRKNKSKNVFETITQTLSGREVVKTNIMDSDKKHMSHDSCNLLYHESEKKLTSSSELTRLSKKKKKKNFRQVISGLFICMAPQRE